MLENLLNKMESVSLQDMESVRLMNRIDTKFLTNLCVLEHLLTLCQSDFMVQENYGIRNASYYTLYYDTQDMKMYCDHQRGKKSRRKVRIREYLDSSDLSFLEIKDKNNKGRTKKKRIIMEPDTLIGKYDDFITKYSEFRVNELNPKIENRFKRITLVNKEKTERITIDTSTEFHNFVTHRQVELPNLVIIEWKRDGLALKTQLKPLLRKLRIQESGFSKYVTGMALTDSSLPQNRLKQRLRMLDKIMR